MPVLIVVARIPQPSALLSFLVPRQGRCDPQRAPSRAGALASAYGTPGAACHRRLPPLLGGSRQRRRGRVAEGGGLLNRYTLLKAYRGFESLRLRHRRCFWLSLAVSQRTVPQHIFGNRLFSVTSACTPKFQPKSGVGGGVGDGEGTAHGTQGKINLKARRLQGRSRSEADREGDEARGAHKALGTLDLDKRQEV